MCGCADAALAQNPGGSAAPAAPVVPMAPGAPGTGASSAFGTPAPGAGLPAATPGTGPGMLNPGAGTSTGPGTGALPQESPDAAGAASAFGEGQSGGQTPPSEPTFTVPSAGYGQPAQQFTAGEGRLARPRFRFTSSLSFGYDDNVFQTPTDAAKGLPSQTVEVLDDPGTAATEVAGIGPDGQPMVVVTPGRAPTTRRVVIPGLPGQQRIGSFLNRGNVGVDVQFASRRTLFTFDVNTGGNFYWDRPGKDVDYTGSLALMYLRRLTPRLQFTANVSAIYQTQPDLSLINTSTQQAGAYLNATGRMSLSYRFTPRLSASANLSYNAFRYQEEAQRLGNYGETTLGTELRYLYNPRFTLIGQLRYSRIAYDTQNALDANTVFALLGGEVTLSRRFTGTLLLGASMRKFDGSGISSTSPYAEGTLAYQLAKATLVQFDARFGFESPANAESELITLRSGINLVQSFSPRFRGTVGVNYVRQNTTFDTTDDSSVINTLNLGLGVVYNLSRQWTLNASYNYTSGFGTFAASDYFRNQAFVGAEYDF